MRSWIFAGLGFILAFGITCFIIAAQKMPDREAAPAGHSSVQPKNSASPTISTKGSNSDAVSLTTEQGFGSTHSVEHSDSVTTPEASAVLENGLSKITAEANTSAGTVKFKFYSLDAPKTTARMITLIQNGFYNGLTFHELKEGAYIQGGDPKGNGSGGSGVTIEDEFNHRPHVLGALAMARKATPNSADSQFYIALEPLPQLDQHATVFGQVVEGLEVIKNLKKGDKIISIKLE